MTPHGSQSTYNNHGCRCDECKAANTAYRQQWRKRVQVDPMSSHVAHGASSTYTNYGCRCDECRSAHSTECKAYRARKAAK